MEVLVTVMWLHHPARPDAAFVMETESGSNEEGGGGTAWQSERPAQSMVTLHTLQFR